MTDEEKVLTKLTPEQIAMLDEFSTDQLRAEIGRRLEKRAKDPNLSKKGLRSDGVCASCYKVIYTVEDHRGGCCNKPEEPAQVSTKPTKDEPADFDIF